MVELHKKTLKGEKTIIVVASGEEVAIRRTALLFGVGSFIGSMFFWSQNITGNVVLGFEAASGNWVGGVLFILAIIGFLVYVQNGIVANN